MAVALRGNYGSSTADLTKPVNLADGDLIVVVAQRNNATPPSLPASGWTSVLTKVATDSSSSLRLAYRHVTTASSEPATYTFTNATAIIAVVVYNHHQTNPIFYSDSQAIDSTAVTLSPSGFTLNSDEFYSFALVSAAVTTGVNSTSAPTNWSHYRFQARMKLARYDMPAATYSSIVYTYGTTAQKLVGVLFVIRPVILPDLATATASSPDATITGAAKTAAPVTTATAAHLAPVAVGSALVLPPLPTVAAEALAPNVTGGLVVVNAVAATGSAALLEPLVRLSVFPPAMSATGELAEPSVAVGAVVSAELMTATATAIDPVALQFITTPVMVMTGAAASPDVRGGAALVAGLATASATAEAPGWGVVMPAPTLVASASGLIPGYVAGALVELASAAMAMGALAPEAGTRKYPARWRGGGASVAPVVRQSTAARREGVGVTVAGGTSETGTTSRRGGVGATVTGRATSGSVAEGEV